MQAARDKWAERNKAQEGEMATQIEGEGSVCVRSLGGDTDLYIPSWSCSADFALLTIVL